MRKIYLAMGLIIAVTSIKAQQSPGNIITSEKSDVQVPLSLDKPAKIQTRADGQHWINYSEAVENLTGAGGPGAGRLGTSLLWPDSTVVIADHPTDGTFHWWQHGYSDIFNPVSKLVQDYLTDQLGAANASDWYNKSHSFKFDSVAFYYLYNRKQNYNDTLKVYLIGPGSTAFEGPYQFNGYPTATDTPRFAIVKYDYLANKPLGTNITEHTIILGQADTAIEFIASKALPVNFTIPANATALGGLVGIAFKFIPGQPYGFGDTIVDASSGGSLVINNPLNTFRLVTFEEINGQYPISWTEERSYNFGNLATTDVRYNLTPAWNGYYITSLAYGPTSVSEHAYIDWLVQARGANFGVSQAPCVNRPIDFTDQSNISPTSWSWNFGDGSAVVTSQNPSHAFTVPGNYNVCLTATGSSGGNTYCKTYTVNFCTGIDDVNSNINIEVYPNPAKDVLTIDVQLSNVQDVDVRVMNIQGQEVYSNLFSKSDRYKTTIDLAKQAEGVYFVQVTSNGYTTTKKVVISR